MKLLGFEDIIAGIFLGIVMVGASGKLYTLPYNDKLLIAFLFLFLILAVLDIIYEIKTIMEDVFFSIFAVLWNIIEIIIVIGYISQIFKLPFEIIAIIPFIGIMGMFGIGIFFILGNIMWLYFYIKY